MNSFARVLQEDMRLVVLRLLAEDADYSHNEYVLKAALKQLGHNISQDKLRTELSWLAEQNLVAIDDASGVQVVKLTRRGKDVADGAVVVPGVKRPEPEV